MCLSHPRHAAEYFGYTGGTLVAQPFDWENGAFKVAPISLGEQPYAYSSSYDPVASFSAADSAIAYNPAELPPTELARPEDGDTISPNGQALQTAHEAEFAPGRPESRPRPEYVPERRLLHPWQLLSN